MGNFVSNLLDSLSGLKYKRIILLGLDAAGKTTILYKLQLGEVIHTIPTIGFNVETIQYKNIEMTCWDVGGQKKIRTLWYHYYCDTDGVIFVVDSSDYNRINEARDELCQLMNNDYLKNAVLLVYANKQDLSNCLLPSQLIEKLGLNTDLSKRDWHIQGTVANNGDGLYEGLDWLVEKLKKQKN